MQAEKDLDAMVTRLRSVAIKSVFLEISRSTIIERLSSCSNRDKNGKRILNDRKKAIERMINVNMKLIKRIFKAIKKHSKGRSVKLSVVPVFETMKEGSSFRDRLPGKVIKKYRVFINEKEALLSDRRNSKPIRVKKDASKNESLSGFLFGDTSGGFFEQ